MFEHILRRGARHSLEILVLLDSLLFRFACFLRVQRLSFAQICRGVSALTLCATFCSVEKNRASDRRSRALET